MGRVFYRPLIPAAVMFIGGIALGAAYSGHILSAAVVLGAGALGCVGQIFRRLTPLIFPLMVFFSLGYLSLQPWLTDHLPPQHVLGFADQGKWQVRGTVVDQPQTRSGRVRFVLDATSLSNGSRSLAVCGKISTTVRGEMPEIGMGDTIRLSGYLHAIRNYSNPGGFDYAQYMALQGIRTRLAAQGNQVQVLSRAIPCNWREWWETRRGWLSRQIDQAMGRHSPDAGVLLKALVIGRRSGLSDAVRDDFNRTGVSHVLAISGLHIGMVAAAVFFVSSRLLAWIPALLTRAWTRQGAALVSFIAVGSYAFLSGMSPSTQRATIMVSVFLMTFWLGRRYDWFNAAAVAALVIGMIYPPAVVGLSFRLSFAAVLTILAGLRFFPLRSSDVGCSLMRRCLRAILMLMYISVLAVAGTLPLVMAAFNRVSLVGAVMNLLVVPVVGWVVLPLGLAGVAISVFSPTLAHLLWHTAGYGLDGILAAVAWVAPWPAAAIQTFTPSIVEMALYFALLGLVLSWKSVPRSWMALALILMMGATDAGYWFYQRYGNRDLRLTVLDVGQGSANVLQLPGGRTMLVDGGGFSDNAVFDVGRLLVAPYLRQLKIGTVDLVVLTHPNSDHLNGLIYILEHFHVPEIWSNNEVQPLQGYRQLQTAIARHGITHPAFEQLARRQERWGVILEILAPEPAFQAQRANQSWRNENEDSLVLRVRKGRVSFLFTGDIGQRTEKSLIQRWGSPHLESTILLVPHHGSRNSACLEFLKAVNPRHAVISAGWQNRYGFPHPDVLGRLAALSCKVWRTDHCGAVRITTDGSGCKVQPTVH